MYTMFYNFITYMKKITVILGGVENIGKQKKKWKAPQGA